MITPLRLSILLILAPLVLGASAPADVVPSRAVSAAELQALRRDDTAAEKALAAGDLAGALRYFDYFGHEQEDFARATLEYRLAREKLAAAVRQRAFDTEARLVAAALISVVPEEGDARGTARAKGRATASGPV